MAVRFDAILNRLLTKYVKTTGDTMTGNLVIEDGNYLVLGSDTPSTAEIRFRAGDSVRIFEPAEGEIHFKCDEKIHLDTGEIIIAYAPFKPTDGSGFDFGTSAAVWTNGHIQSVILNATAKIDGTAAGLVKVDGNFLVEPASDTTTSFQITKADTTIVLNVDTTNARVGIGTNAPTHPLHVFTSQEEIVSLYRDTNTQNDNMLLSFRAKNDADTVKTYATWGSRIIGNTAGNELSLMEIKGMRSGSLVSLVQFDASFTTTFNVGGENINFRIEGITDPSLFYLDAGNEAVTIGSSTELAKFGIDGNADEIQFAVQANATQTSNVLQQQQSDGTVVISTSNSGSIYTVDNISVGTASPSASFRGAGDIYATSGIKAMEGLSAEAVAYGAGLEIQDNALAVTYTNAAHGDATLTAATQLITDSHATFTDSYIGQFFKCISSDPSFTGATGEIIGVPSSTTLVVSFGTAGGDTIVNATDMSFVVYPAPNFFVGDHGESHLKIGENENAHFHIVSPHGNNTCAIEFNAVAGINNHTAFCLTVDANSYGSTSAYGLNFDATSFANGNSGTGLDVIVDNLSATGGHFHAVDVAVSDPTEADMETVAVATSPGVDVIHQHLGDIAAVTAGFEGDQSGGPSYTDRTTAFGDSGTNVQIFDADDDFILIAAVAKWDQINVLLNIVSSITIAPTFHYITDAGAWVAFTPSDDTNGFTQNGTIRFDQDDLTTWGVRTVAEVTGSGATDDLYWIKITRTRNNVPIPPTESTIKITATGTLHEWDKAGRLAIKTYNQSAEPTTSDLPAGKFCFWTDTDDSKLYICYNHGGTIKTTEMV